MITSLPLTVTGMGSRPAVAGPFLSSPVVPSYWLPCAEQVMTPFFGGSTIVPLCLQAALNALTSSPDGRTRRILPPPGRGTTRPLPCGTSASAASFVPAPSLPPVPVDPPPPVGVPAPFELESVPHAATSAPGASKATTRPHNTSRRDEVSIGSVVGSTAVTRFLP